MPHATNAWVLSSRCPLPLRFGQPALPIHCGKCVLPLLPQPQSANSIRLHPMQSDRPVRRSLNYWLVDAMTDRYYLNRITAYF
jgi:hypothetical protein